MRPPNVPGFSCAGRANARAASAANRCWAAPRGTSSSSAQDFDVARQLGSKTIRLDLQVVGSLKVQPETGRVPKKSAQAQCRVGTDGALAMNDLVDPTCRHLQAFREAILRERERLQELFFQNLARMNGSKSLSRHGA